MVHTVGHTEWTFWVARYHDGGRLSDQQMALLQYQRENLHYLSEEILRLQECLSKYERADDGSTPQVDLAHLLAARDQELRALSAENRKCEEIEERGRILSRG
ncbi:Cleavage polyadenylation factor subunit fip1 [Asimina triloba]